MKTLQPYFTLGDGTGMVESLFLTKRAKNAMNREYREGPIETYPGIFSTDPRLVATNRDFALEALKDPRFAVNVDDNGRCYGNGIRSDFLGLLAIPGYPMHPATWPLVDNTIKRKSLGLITKGFAKPWHERAFRSIVRLAFSGLETQHLRIRNNSSTCIPYFHVEMGEKLALAFETMENAQKAGELMEQGKFEEAWDLYRIGGAYYVVYREQTTDRVKINKSTGKIEPKDRWVATFEYAISGGLSGKQIVSDKTFFQEELADFAPTEDLHVFDKSVRTRRRTAWGGPAGINYSLMPIAQAVRANLYSKYPLSFHARDRSSTERELQSWDYVIMTDVEDHDIAFYDEIFDLWASELLNMGYAKWWVKLFRTSFQLPVYVSSPGVNQGKTLLGDPFNPSLKPGLSSGNAFTDLLGTGNMAPTYMIAQIEWTAPWLESRFATQESSDKFVHEYLSHREEISQKSKSDDAALLWRRNSDSLQHAIKWQELLTQDESHQPSVYNKVSYEKGGAFLGPLLLFDSSRRLESARMIGNIISMLTKMQLPEYSVNSKAKDRRGQKRGYPGLAWASLDAVYGSAPMYREALELLETVWFRHFKFSFSRYRERLFEDDKRQLALDLQQAGQHDNSKLIVDSLSPKELELLASPDKIHYKILPSEVRPEIVLMIMNGIPKAVVDPFVRTIVPPQHMKYEAINV